MKRVLVIEDDPGITDLLEIHLNDLDCEVLKAADGKVGLDMALEEEVQLIILDITLPTMDGIAVCQKIRAQKSTPIVMLTAKSEEIDRVLGLEIGADDYITKPFSIREFIARIKALFRRTQMIEERMGSKNEMALMHFQGLSIDVDKRRVMLDDQKVELSPKEFELLVLMASHPGKSYSRSELLKLIWGYDFHGYEHTVNSHINRLRAKVERDMAKPEFIITTWGVGYKFNEEMA
jgi:DNA-binding response OmpR family regulator